MDTTLDKEENAKNIYVIRRKLATLKKVPGRSHYEFPVGHFVVNIFTYRVQDEPPDGFDCILKHQTVSVVLNEVSKTKGTSSVSLIDDSRFKNYEPIRYNTFEGPNGIVNMSNGDGMPILQLCELIRYLYRLSNLTAFL